MRFVYERQGAITYLVCELDPAEQVDTLTLGMLTNNHIAGVAPVIYTEMNGNRYLKYNVSAKVSADQFFGGNMNRERALCAFKNILNALCSADDYMIEQNCFSMVPEHVFLNVSNCETALICVPVITDRNINAETAALFKKVLFTAQFDQSEDAGYIAQMIGYVNNVAGFNVYGFLDLVNQIQAAPAPARVAPQPASIQNPFEGTISIDDMAGMEKKAEPAAPAEQPPVQQPPVEQPPVQRPPVQQPPVAQPPVLNQPPVNAQRPPMPGQPPVNGQHPPMPGQPPVNGQRPPMPGQPPVNGQRPPMPGQPPVNAQRPPIPGKPPVNAQRPPMPPAPGQQPAKQPAANGEKKMTLIGLLSHYNKENAALYKAQKEAKKNKQAAPAQQPPIPGQPPMGQQRPPMPGQPPVNGQRPPMPGQPPVNGQRPPVQPQQPVYAVPQYQPAVQPVPVQNSFNETTVLSPIGGETTVLNASAPVSEPALTRIKTGERIVINKPVFRIGKEKSYVDYFIGDNTAISRSHANIHTENGNYFIEDTNSTNHTYINGQILTSNVKTKLTSGDKVRLANEDFIFSL